MNTKELEEYIKCSQDPVYFINTYVLKLYDFQRNVIDNFMNDDLLIIRKARQLGFTTILCAWSLWNSLFFPNKNIIHFTYAIHSKGRIFDKIIEMYMKLPLWLTNQIKIISKDKSKEILFSNNSSIVFYVGVSSTLYGKSKSKIDLIIFDEAALIEELEEIYEIFEHVDCKKIIVSTPKIREEYRQKSYFEKLYTENVNFTCLHYPWYVNSSNSYAWFASYLKSVGEMAVAQDLEAEFFYTRI